MSSLVEFLRPSQQSNIRSLALLVLRLAVGMAFVIHGWPKIQNPMGWALPPPTSPISISPFFQLLAAIAEFGGGLAFIFGFLTRIASLGIMSVMSVAIYLLAILMHEPFVNLTGPIAYELNVAYWCIAFLLLIFGPGQFSLDRAVFGLDPEVHPAFESPQPRSELTGTL